MQTHRVLIGVWITGVLLLLGTILGPTTTRADSPHGPPNPAPDTSGRGDLAIGVPYEQIGDTVDAGAVNIIRGGSAGGLSSTGNQVWHQDSTGSVTSSEADDLFGYVLAMGDFNHDKFMDLAVGIPYEDEGLAGNSGGVQVWYGTPDGITATGNQFWSQGSTGIAGDPETDDTFGYSLAVGDFNGDRYDDLAIGVPGESIGAVDSAGAVQVLYGSATGLSASASQLWYQGTSGVQGVAETADGFGRALAAGDLNGDGYDDLAIGVPYENFVVTDAGVVQVLFGSATGLTATGNQLWSQNSTDILDSGEIGDYFGSALTIGDWNGDGYNDLTVGVADEDIGATGNAGAVNVFYGSSDGLSATGNQFWYQGLSGLQGTPEPSDYFGESLMAGDFNHDGYDDLVVGVPHEDSTFMDDGIVQVLFGSAAGLTATGNQLWSQNSTDILDTAEMGEFFGFALAAGDFDHDGYDDLAIGVPYESIGAIPTAGAVNVLYGSNAGLSALGNQFWSQASPDIGGAAEVSDFFGSALAAVRAVTYKLHLPLVLQ